MTEPADMGDPGAGWDRWLDTYNARFQPAFAPDVRKPLRAFHDLALDVRAAGRKLILAGNGASASLASHGRVDFQKQAGVRAIDFNEPNLITAFANDYGFEHWVARAIEQSADPGDAVVLISVSGNSPNIVRAAEYAKSRALPVVAFTGSAPDNKLRRLADIDFWLESKAYNVVECVHAIWLTTVITMIVGRAECPVS
ncbi:MAG TPA: SIS domain-containing protein [Stellaceae bacterium]|nr:SIS domain-containing protein [Stellaceae bacterium]